MADEVRYDVDGYEEITQAVKVLINQYPALLEGDKISFATLEADSGKAFFTLSGAVIRSEKESITGHVEQKCLYPFVVEYRASGLSENNKVKVKEWLDDLGKWLEKQPVTIKGQEYKLDEYPLLKGNRQIESIRRQSNGYLDSINDNKSENWLISLVLNYTNSYDL